MNFKKVVALSICAAMVAGMSASTVMAADLPDQFKDLKANEAYEFPMMVKSFQSTYWDAAQVFRVGPPIRYIVTSVVIKHTNTAVQKGEYFRYTRGRYTKITQKNVKTSPRHPFIPCFPPIRQRTSR